MHPPCGRAASVVVAVFGVCVGGCVAQTRPHGIEGDAIATVYPTTMPDATTGVTYEPGIVGLALSLERAGACVRRPQEGHLDPSGGTIELWLSPMVPVKEMPDFGPIVSVVADPFAQSIPGSMLLILANDGMQSHGQLVFMVNAMTGNPLSFVATAPLDWEVGSWHHVAVSWGAQGMAIRADGREVMTNKSTATPRKPAELIGIGGHAYPGAWSQPCRFRIDELRISSTRRSQEEIDAAIRRVQGGQPLEEDPETLLLEHFDGTPAPPLRFLSGHPAHIIPEGERPAVDLEVWAETREPIPLSWELTDLTGVRVVSGDGTAMPGDRRPSGVSMPIALGDVEPGVYNLRVSPTSGQGPACGTTVWIGARPEEPLMDAASAFGQSGCYARDLGEDVFEAQRRMGVKWSRVSFVWREIEPEQDRFEWAKYDEIVRLAAKYGVELVPTFQWEDAIPAWAGTPQVEAGQGVDNKRNLPPNDIADWQDYVRKVVARYRESVRWWIPWNEPNLTRYLGPERDPAKYVELLKACAEAVHGADPDAHILGMSVSLVDLKYYEECFELGALQYSDAVGCHPYRMGTDPDESSVGLNWLIGQVKPRTWLEELQELRALIDRYAGGRRLGIWLDEMGQPTEEDFPIPNSGVTEQTAAIYLARMYAEGLGTGVIDKGLWFSFHGYGSFSLLRDDFTLKPEAVTYRLLASVLAGKHGMPEEARTGSVHAYRFEGDGAGAWIVWAAETQDASLAAPLDGVHAYDILGRPVPITAADGTVAVRAGAIPIIIEWSGPRR